MPRFSKVFEADSKAATLEENSYSVIPSVMGIIDRGSDVIFPKAYSDTVTNKFLKTGFVSDTHNWTMMGLIGMPDTLSVEGNKLKSTGTFHSTPKAQEVRTLCLERLAKGLSIGVSVGFMADRGDYKWFENGKELLKYADKEQYDMSLFNKSQIEKHDRYCVGILKVSELVEYAICPIGMNQQSLVQGVKANGIEESVNPESLNEFFAQLKDFVSADIFNKVSELLQSELTPENNDLEKTKTIQKAQILLAQARLNMSRV